jgi:hypothetical protein
MAHTRARERRTRYLGDVGQFTETEANYDKTFFIVYLNNTW